MREKKPMGRKEPRNNCLSAPRPQSFHRPVFICPAANSDRDHGGKEVACTDGYGWVRRGTEAGRKEKQTGRNEHRSNRLPGDHPRSKKTAHITTVKRGRKIPPAHTTTS